jgi:hypothetical protein
VGHILRQDGEVIEHAFMGNVYGDIRLPAQSTSDLIDITFLDEDSLEVTVGDPFTLRWVVIDTMVVRFEQMGAWSFVLHGGQVPGTTQLFLRLWDVDHSAYTSPANPVIIEEPIGIAEPVAVPSHAPVLLLPIVPNPVGPLARIGYELREPMSMTLRILDVNGRVLDLLADGHFPPGEHVLHWSSAGRPNGNYFVEMTTPLGRETRKLVLAR